MLKTEQVAWLCFLLRNNLCLCFILVSLSPPSSLFSLPLFLSVVGPFNPFVLSKATNLFYFSGREAKRKMLGSAWKQGFSLYLSEECNVFRGKPVCFVPQGCSSFLSAYLPTSSVLPFISYSSYTGKENLPSVTPSCLCPM